MSNFSCRGRTLRLSPTEADLALHGVIDASLRYRSSVYYWKHVEPPQKRSRHEAVCTKDRRWHLRSFGSHSWWAQAAREKCAFLLSWGALDSCSAFDLGDLPLDWRGEHGVNESIRGAGWWRWKPYYLLRELRKLGEGEVLVHVDYDLQFSRQPDALWCIGQNSETGIAAFHMPCLTDRAWCKQEVAASMHATDAMLDTTQLYAGLLAMRRTSFAEQFLEQWLQLVLQDGLATDALSPHVRQHPRFIAHRHDQSILSLLAKQQRVKTYPLPTVDHDIRDVWSWDAGYCKSSFTWPLSSYRPRPNIITKAYPHGVYISHYKEMGHQRDTMEDCLAKEPQTVLVPLPDYTESAAILAEMKAIKRLEAVVRERGRWNANGASHGGGRFTRQRRSGGQRLSWFAPQTLKHARHQPPVLLIHQERNAKEVQEHARCKANTSFGGLYFEGRPYMWTKHGECRGLFECSSTVLRCGIFIYAEAMRRMKAQSHGRDWLRICSCDETESLRAARHWRDGRDHPANNARSIE